MDNRATSLDFSRFWWELYSEKGWSFADIVDVVDLVDPHHWDGRDEPDADWEDQPVWYLLLKLLDLESTSVITQQMFDDWTDGMMPHGLDR